MQIKSNNVKFYKRKTPAAYGEIEAAGAVRHFCLTPGETVLEPPRLYTIRATEDFRACGTS